MQKSINTNFKKDCKVINLAYEYKGYTGKEKYAIITDLSEEELNLRYKDEIKRYRPFIILSRKMGLAIREFDRNDEKFRKRSARNESIFIACDEQDELVFSSLSVEDDQTIKEAESEELENKQRIREVCTKALDALTPKQRYYFVLHFVEGKSIRKIAHEVGIHRNTVLKNCLRARARYIKAVNAMEAES